jgi:hypothetical protein
LFILVGWKKHISQGQVCPQNKPCGQFKSHFAKRYLMKAMFGCARAVAVVMGRVYHVRYEIPFALHFPSDVFWN